jgi:hypothetical protein
MRRFLAIIFSVLLLLPSQPVAAEPWTFNPGDIRSQGKSAVRIEEAYDTGKPSAVMVSVVNSANGSSASYACLEYPSTACPTSILKNSFGVVPSGATYPYKRMDFFLVMPACEVASSKDFCIEDVRIYGVDAEPVSATFLQAVDDTTTAAIPSVGVPAGGHISLWQGAAGSGFENLKMAAVVQANFVYYPFSGPNFVINDFSAQLIPYQDDRSLNYSAVGLVPIAFGPDGAPAGEGLGGRSQPMPGCVWQVEGVCGKRIDSPQGVKYGITIRSATKLAAFMNGRLKGPNLAVSEEGSVSVLKLDAEPVQVAEFGLVYDPTPEIKRRMPSLPEGGIYTKPFFPDAQKIIETFRDLAGDKASGENTSWRLSTVGVAGLSRCYSDYGIAGLVTTNATTYGGEPPTLENGFLNYTVAGMHYLSNGSDLFVGTYDLIIRSEVARCLYGYSKAPVSATVTVVGDDGEENVATTVVSERDGWLKLAAYGFTFSEKEIRVKLSQPQTRTLTAYSRTATALTAKQKAEIRATVTKGAANPKFICTGIRLEGQPQALNTLVRKRAKLACDYAKSINPKLSTFFQTKTTKARSFNGKVLVVSK